MDFEGGKRLHSTVSTHTEVEADSDRLMLFLILELEHFLIYLARKSRIECYLFFWCLTLNYNNKYIVEIGVGCT